MIPSGNTSNYNVPSPTVPSNWMPSAGAPLLNASNPVPTIPSPAWMPSVQNNIGLGVASSPSAPFPTPVSLPAADQQPSFFGSIGQGISNFFDWGTNTQKPGGLPGETQQSPFSLGIQAAQGLGNAWLGMRGLDLAQDRFDFAKSSFNKNFEQQRKSTNRQLEDRARVDAAQGGNTSVADYMAKHGV